MSKKLTEAVTIKSRIRGFLKAAGLLLGEKELSDDVRSRIAGLQADMKKTWGALALEMTPVTEAIIVNGLELSHSEARDLIRQAIEDELRSDAPPAEDPTAPVYFGVWVQDVYETWVAYTDDAAGKTYQRVYAISGAGFVALGAPTEVIVQKVYIPVGDPGLVAEAFNLESDFVSLLERSVDENGSTLLKLIAPGWGSSGYYPADVLERDGPRVFAAGTKMYWDHPTVSGEAERPERSLRDLAAELVADARWMVDGVAGPGLYAEATVFELYRAHVEELAPHIGVSIRALGKAKEGEAEGRTGSIVEEVVSAKSIDFVTEPGAGGQILSLFESARTPKIKKEVTVDEKQAQKLTDSNTALTATNTALAAELAALKVEADRLREAEILRSSMQIVLEALPDDLPAIVKARLVKALGSAPVIVDGKIDQEAFKAKIAEAAKAELEYVTTITGGTGQIIGMGRTTPTAAEGNAQLKEAFLNKYRQEGKSEAEAEQLATTAARGR